MPEPGGRAPALGQQLGVSRGAPPAAGFSIFSLLKGAEAACHNIRLAFFIRGSGKEQTLTVEQQACDFSPSTKQMVLSEQDSSLGCHESSSLWIAVDSGCSLRSSATGKETARRSTNTYFSLKSCGLLFWTSSVLWFLLILWNWLYYLKFHNLKMWKAAGIAQCYRIPSFSGLSYSVQPHGFLEEQQEVQVPV